MLKFFILYSIATTLYILYTYTVRKNRSGSNRVAKLETELRRSRETITEVRRGLTECRDILSSSNEGLTGVIERLRGVAKEVEVLEKIIDDSYSCQLCHGLSHRKKVLTNKNVYLKKLKLPEAFLSDKRIDLMLRKPGTLSKKEKNWLIAYCAVLDLTNTKNEIRRDKLSADFIRSLNK